MILQIDTKAKTIKVEETVNFGELVKTLNKLLPKGEWKTYKLETNTVINWNEYPVWTYPIFPFYPTYPNEPFYYGNTIPLSGTIENVDVLNIEISGDTITTNTETQYTLTQ